MITLTQRGNIWPTVYTCFLYCDDIEVGGYSMATILMTYKGLLHGNHIDEVEC